MVYVRHRGTTNWVPVEALPTFGLEKELEALLWESPQLLPGQPTNLALVRQLAVPAVNGVLDLCGVTSDGAVYLVECKLATNPEIRRTVVGQLLAYAAGLAGTAVEDFLSSFARAAAPLRGAGDPASYFDGLPEAERDPDYDRARLLEQLGDNLRDGRFRLVFAVDRLTPELERIVDYLDRHLTEASISALALQFARYDDVELATPTWYGAASVADKTSSPASPPPTSLADFKQAEAVLDEHVRTAFAYIRRVSVEAGGEIWGSRKSQPTLNCSYSVGSQAPLTWVMSANPKRPGFGIMWRWLLGPLSSERLTKLYDELKDIPGAEIWQNVDVNWNYVNLLDARVAFKDPDVAPRVMTALHQALALSSRLTAR